MLSAWIETPASIVLRDCCAPELSEAQGLARLWLTEAERAVRDRFPAQKRRDDWLAGRVAAKRALGQALGLDDGAAGRLTVANEPSGAPFALHGGHRLDRGFSISHCSLGGLAVVAGPGKPVGCDWEPIAERPARVVELFAHESELPGPRDSAAITGLWVRKEAVLKLLGLGLGVDPREARFPGGAGRPALFGAADARWRELGSPRISIFETLRDGACLAVAFVDA